jgi:L-ascorbate metabolism protein UlaG (beta-lactamase superfamily)
MPAPAALSISWLGHATVVLDFDGVRVLTDPLLRDNVGLLRRVGPLPEPDLWRDPDIVLISHLHHDHAEVSSLRLVPGVPVLTGAANAAWVRRRLGVECPDPGDDWYAVGHGVEVRLVRADHTARPMPHRPNDAHGHLVRDRSTAVWFAGDTSLYPEMADLPKLAGGAIDVALVPIGGWGPKLSPGHMGPAEAVEACAMVRPTAVLPIHHGTLHPPRMGGPWVHKALAEFRELLPATCPDVALLDVPPGGTVTWPG